MSSQLSKIRSVRTYVMPRTDSRLRDNYNHEFFLFGQTQLTLLNYVGRKQLNGLSGILCKVAFKLFNKLRQNRFTFTKFLLSGCQTMGPAEKQAKDEL